MPRPTRDAVVTAIRQFVADAEQRSTTYDASNPDVYEQMIEAALHYVRRSAKPTIDACQRRDLEEAIRNDSALHSHPMLSREARYAHSHTMAEGGYDVQAHDNEERRRVDVASREATRVLNQIRDELRSMLADGSYKRYSNPIDYEFMAAVSVQYPVAVAAAIEHEVTLNYQRSLSLRRRHRPYLTSIYRYNVRQPLRREPKQVFCTMFFFHFVQDPEAVVVANGYTLAPPQSATAPPTSASSSSAAAAAALSSQSSASAAATDYDVPLTKRRE